MSYHVITEEMKILFVRHGKLFNKLLFSYKRLEGLLKNIAVTKIQRVIRMNIYMKI